MTLTRQELSQIFPNSPKAVLEFSRQQKLTEQTASTLASNVEATGALQDATVLTLSPNATFTNERVLKLGDGISADDDGTYLTLRMTDPIEVNGGFRVALNLASDTFLDLPPNGRVLVDAGPFADDTAAAAGGVEVGQLYRKTGGAVAWRVA